MKSFLKMAEQNVLLRAVSTLQDPSAFYYRYNTNGAGEGVYDTHELVLDTLLVGDQIDYDAECYDEHLFEFTCKMDSEVSSSKFFRVDWSLATNACNASKRISSSLDVRNVAS